MSQRIHQDEGVDCYCDSGDQGDSSGEEITSESDSSCFSDCSCESHASGDSRSSGESRSSSESRCSDENVDTSESDGSCGSYWSRGSYWSCGSDSSGESVGFSESDRSVESDSCGESDDPNSELSNKGASEKDKVGRNEGGSRKFENVAYNGSEKLDKESVYDHSVVRVDEPGVGVAVAKVQENTGSGRGLNSVDRELQKCQSRKRPPRGFYSESPKSPESSNTARLAKRLKSASEKLINLRKRGKPVYPYDVRGILAKRQKKNGKFQYLLVWASNIWVDEDDMNADELVSDFNSKEHVQIRDKIWVPVGHNFISSQLPVFCPQNIDVAIPVLTMPINPFEGNDHYDVCGILAKRQKEDGKFEYLPVWESNIWVDEDDINADELLTEFNSKEHVQIRDKIWVPVGHNFISPEPFFFLVNKTSMSQSQPLLRNENKKKLDSFVFF